MPPASLALALLEEKEMMKLTTFRERKRPMTLSSLCVDGRNKGAIDQKTSSQGESTSVIEIRKHRETERGRVMIMYTEDERCSAD